MTDVNPPGLTRRDFAFLRAVRTRALSRSARCSAACSPVTNRFSRRRAGRCSAAASWLVPTIGGDPWLERPPVPMWLICGVYSVAGNSRQSDCRRRASPQCSSRCHRAARRRHRQPALRPRHGPRGRVHLRDDARGVLLLEQPRSRHLPRAHRHRGARGLRAAGVWGDEDPSPEPTQRGERGLCSPSPLREGGWGVRFFGPGFFSPPLLVAVFFALLGATNLAKGVIFGTAMAAVPVAGYLLWNRSRVADPALRLVLGIPHRRRGRAGVARSSVIGQHPEILQLWKEHYFGRLNRAISASRGGTTPRTSPTSSCPWTSLRSSASG